MLICRFDSFVTRRYCRKVIMQKIAQQSIDRYAIFRIRILCILIIFQPFWPCYLRNGRQCWGILSTKFRCSAGRMLRVKRQQHRHYRSGSCGVLFPVWERYVCPELKPKPGKLCRATVLFSGQFCKSFSQLCVVFPMFVVKAG